MKLRGAVRKLDSLGRVCLPIELRRDLNLNVDEDVEIIATHDSIILKKYVPGCHCCGEHKVAAEVLGFRLCNRCLDNFDRAREEINKLR